MSNSTINYNNHNQHATKPPTTQTKSIQPKSQNTTNHKQLKNK